MSQKTVTNSRLASVKGNESNTEVTLDKATNVLTIRIDLNKDCGLTSAENKRIASTHGNMTFQESPIEGLVLGLNCYVKEPKVKITVSTKQAQMLEAMKALTPDQVASIIG